VHDIGKNLVEIILKNNGYEVVNLASRFAGRIDQGLPGAQAGRHWIVRAVGEECAADGDHGEHLKDGD